MYNNNSSTSSDSSNSEEKANAQHASSTDSTSEHTDPAVADEGFPAEQYQSADLEKQQLLIEEGPGGFPYITNPERFYVSLEPSDPRLAVNWPTHVKILHVALLAFTTLTASWGSSVFSAAATIFAAKYHIGLTVALLGMSLYVCGFASGPILWAPISELVGRKIPLIVGMFMFSIFSIAVAVAKDVQTVMICRFFSGFCASSPLSVVAAAFADMFDNKTRGPAVCIFACITFAGPLIGPIAGGFLAKSYLGWRWTEYITSFMGFFSTLCLLFMKECYSRTITEQEAARLRVEYNNNFIRAKSEEEYIDFKALAKRYLAVPFVLLFCEPIVFLLTLYMSFVYGILYLLLEAYPIIFAEKRHFSLGVDALPYIGLLVGVILGAALIAYFQGYYNRKLDANGGKPVPKARLPPMMIGSVLFPAGIFWLAWSGYYTHVHWIVPTLSGLLTGCGILTIFMQSLIYLIDAYLFRAASVIAANTIMRSLVAAGFPLFAVQMFHNMGIGWAGSLLGFIATALIPIPTLFFIFGKRIRLMSKNTVNL